MPIYKLQFSGEILIFKKKKKRKRTNKKKNKKNIKLN